MAVGVPKVKKVLVVLVQAARRELEHQRQVEWERQRHDQLTTDKLREQSVVERLSVEVAQLRQELDVLVSWLQ